MINGDWILVLLLYLLIPILVIYAIVSIAIDARAIRRLLERQEASRPGVRSRP
jgi:hypothetical protein